MSWRKLSRAIHRDIGYATSALILAYALSGLAVNHIEDWNPNYRFHEAAIAIGPLPASSPDAGAQVDLNAMEAHVITQLGIDRHAVKGRFMESESLFRVFMEQGQEVRVDIRTGRGTMKRVETRFLLYEINQLHLNSIKGAWTWVADIFAICLMLLVITGLSMVKGPQGLAGRGKWYVGAGLAVPVVFILYMYYGAGLHH